MNHQPFENWLLSEEPLTPDEMRTLDSHLSDCQQCKQLQDGWRGVIDLFQDVPDVAPKAGFTVRWTKRLAKEKQLDKVMRDRWQSVIMLILLANVVTGLVVLLGTQFFTIFDTPSSLVLSGIYRLISTVTLVNTIQNITFTLIRTLTGIVPAGVWALLGLGLIGSIVTWIVSIKSLSILPRRMQQ